MFDFDFLSRFDEISFRANMLTQGSTGRTTTGRTNAKSQVPSDWYEQMLRKIRESVEGVDDESGNNAGTSDVRSSSVMNGTTNTQTSGAYDNRTGNISEARTRENDPVTDRRIWNLSMSEYESYIADKISSFRVSSTRATGSQAIQISDDGLRAMRDDPEYEAWVLDSIEKDLFAYDPWSGRGDTYKVDYYGARKSDYHSWSNYGRMNDPDAKDEFATKSAGAIWSRGAGAKAVRQTSNITDNSAQIQERQRLEEERQKQQLMLEYYNAMRSNPFSGGTSSSLLDAYMAAAGNGANDGVFEYTMRNMSAGLF